MDGPLVSFVIPCYKLAHYLRACLDSLLGQTYKNLELLIMDDCSPDDTPAVAASYSDARVRYFRNDPNLGHLRNYNRGIGLARGDYVWLISADDCLRSKHAVEQFVTLMEQDSRLAYIFCPAMGLGEKGDETGVVEWTRPFKKDVVIEGRQFLATLAEGNCISAPSVMVRRRCYETAGKFPLDLPHAGDWYLWCAFSFCGDVAYLSEPMVCYRIHGSNMSSTLIAGKRHVVREDQARVRWLLKDMADKAGFSDVAKICVERLAKQYSVDLAEADPAPTRGSMIEAIDTVLERHARNDERGVLRTLIYGLLADHLFAKERFVDAAYFYAQALRGNPVQLGYAAKLALLKLGHWGVAVRKAASRLRRMVIQE